MNINYYYTNNSFKGVIYLKKNNKMKDIHQLTNVQLYSSNKYATKSKEPNDGTFISYDNDDEFSANGTVRYGEETDVDDL